MDAQRARVGVWVVCLALSFAGSTAATTVQGDSSVGPKVLLVYDLEGVTSVTGRGSTGVNSDSYADTRESLKEDVDRNVSTTLRHPQAAFSEPRSVKDGA